MVKDGVTWDQLARGGVRSVLGLDLEAAAIAETARRLEISDWVVVKGVMDYADPRKNDNFKAFAARAAAEVLFEFLLRQVPDDTASLPHPSPNVRADSATRPSDRQGDGASLNSPRRGLTAAEVHKVVWEYIGAPQGYLDNFGRRSLAEFLTVHCNLDVDWDKFQGSMAQQFEGIAASLAPADQSKLLHGLLERFSHKDEADSTRRSKLRAEVSRMARRIESGEAPSENPSISEVLDAYKMLLVRRSRFETVDAVEYHGLRNRLLSDALVRDQLPDFVKTCTDQWEFWSFIKERSSTYDGRREFIYDAFRPILDFLDVSARASGATTSATSS